MIITALQRIVGWFVKMAPSVRKRAPLLLLGVGTTTACAPTLDVGRTRVTESNPCLFVDFEPSGVVRLCGREYAQWSGRSFTSQGFVAFELDGDYLMVKGRRSVKVSGSELVAVTDNPTPDLRFHMTPDGDIIDGFGKRHGTIRPVPADPRVLLIAFAALKDGVVVEAFSRAVSLGTRSPCTCQ